VTSLPILLLLSLTPQASAERALPFTEKGWALEGERTALVNEDGRDVLQVETGVAERRDVQFEDGTIDVDVQVTGHRSFVYFYFRIADAGEREEFYLRPHKSELPDAVQYAPVFQGRSSWQLYHGPGGTAAVAFEPGAWTHVRIAVKGRSAALFVKDMERPALLVQRLAREPRPGWISLGGFRPPDTPGKGAIAKFANVTVRPGAPAFDLDAAVAKAAEAPAASAATPPRGSPEPTQPIRSWAVSRAFVPREDPNLVVELPAANIAGQFQPFDTYANGLLELHRHVQVPKGSRTTAAVARVQVTAQKAGTYVLDLGFSDIATVFLNGRPIYRGTASYSYDLPRREGLIEYDQARLYVPLTAGDNDLSVLIADSFGGWGLMGRFVGTQGLTVKAR
jgi:hypothetical protein